MPYIEGKQTNIGGAGLLTDACLGSSHDPQDTFKFRMGNVQYFSHFWKFPTRSSFPLIPLGLCKNCLYILHTSFFLKQPFSFQCLLINLCIISFFVSCPRLCACDAAASQIFIAPMFCHTCAYANKVNWT